MVGRPLSVVFLHDTPLRFLLLLFTEIVTLILFLIFLVAIECHVTLVLNRLAMRVFSQNHHFLHISSWRFVARRNRHARILVTIITLLGDADIFFTGLVGGSGVLDLVVVVVMLVKVWKGLDIVVNILLLLAFT